MIKCYRRPTTVSERKLSLKWLTHCTGYPSKKLDKNRNILFLPKEPDVIIFFSTCGNEPNGLLMHWTGMLMLFSAVPVEGLAELFVVALA